MFVKQISVYLENAKGSLRELVELLGKNEINLLALSIADTTGFGIIRMIVKSVDLEKTSAVLKEHGYISKTNDVVCVRIPHRPLGLANVLRLLEENNISVEYSYSFCRSTLTDASVILRPSDKQACIDALKAGKISLISQEQVDEF